MKPSIATQLNLNSTASDTNANRAVDILSKSAGDIPINRQLVVPFVDPGLEDGIQPAADIPMAPTTPA